MTATFALVPVSPLAVTVTFAAVTVAFAAVMVAFAAVTVAPRPVVLPSVPLPLARAVVSCLPDLRLPPPPGAGGLPGRPDARPRARLPEAVRCDKMPAPGKGFAVPPLTLLVLWTDAHPDLADACLGSLRRTLPAGQAEVVLVDGSSGSPGVDTLEVRLARLPGGVPRWPVVRPGSPATNLAGWRNAAVDAAPQISRFLGFVSLGTVFLPGWLPPMLRALQRAPRAGVVGNLHREPYSGLIDHAGLRFGADGLPTPGPSRALPPPDPWDRHPTVSLACAVFPRELFERIGGFDPRFEGPLGDVDFCLRAAAEGARHYVANGSVVYHAPDPAPGPGAAADLARFRALWGDRAQAAHVRRVALRDNPPAVYSPEAWEMAREARRLGRRAALQPRRHGWTYLRKHWHRPWRYNYERVCRALVQALTPRPAALPLHPGGPSAYPADAARPDDGPLFDPPPQP